MLDGIQIERILCASSSIIDFSPRMMSGFFRMTFCRGIGNIALVHMPVGNQQIGGEYDFGMVSVFFDMPYALLSRKLWQAPCLLRVFLASPA